MTINRRALLGGITGAAAMLPFERAIAQALAESGAADPIATALETHTMPPGWVKPDQIAMLCYEGMTILDLIGPQYMFAALMGSTVHLVAKTKAPLTSDTGVTMIPSATFDECPAELTVLFVPGGTVGTLAVMRDEATRAFLADRGSRAQYVTSVCTGALVLGAAGLLDGYRATTHWAALETLADVGATPVAERVVRDRNRITGAGVTAGLDFGLTMVGELRDPVYAQGVQLGCEYDPQPPFNAGSTATASDEVKAIMQMMYANFPGQVRETLRSVRGPA